MATLHVRNVPDDLYELLRERAAENDRSIGAETIQLLQERLTLGASPRPGWFPMQGRRRPSGRPGPFTHFTPGAREAVVGSQNYARELRHDHVGTEHVLVGILDTAAGTALARALGRLGVTAKRVRSEVERTQGRGEATPKGQIPFRPETKKALELALRETLKLGDGAIAVEHLLLGILGVEGGGHAILREVEPDDERLRRCAIAARVKPIESVPLLQAGPSFRVVPLEGDPAAWERQLNEAAALGYDLVEIVDKRAVLRRF
jgi:antitoxin FitA-like protein/ClpA/ClpB-like protein